MLASGPGKFPDGVVLTLRVLGRVQSLASRIATKRAGTIATFTPTDEALRGVTPQWVVGTLSGKTPTGGVTLLVGGALAGAALEAGGSADCVGEMVDADGAVGA